MRIHAMRHAVIPALLILLLSVGSSAQQRPDSALAATAIMAKSTVVLDTSSFWRYHYNFRMPVVRTKDGIQKIPTAAHEKGWRRAGLPLKTRWLEYDMPLPAANWISPDFDDSSWARFPGVIVAGVSTHKKPDRKSPYMALVCMRGKFRVNDRARAKGMTLSLAYRGGVVVYLNGREIARGHLPKTGKIGPNVLAEDYRKGESRTRNLTDVPVPSRLLRKGTNVLAVEVHRAPYSDSDSFRIATNWTRTFFMGPATCGPESIRLKIPAASASSVVPNVSRPKGLQVWNSNPLAADFDLDYGDPNETLKPIRIVGTLGGSFSGKVIVGSAEAMKGIRASVSDLVALKGPGRIPASSVRVRYALPGVSEKIGLEWEVMNPVAGGREVGANTRYLASVTRFDALAEFPPTEIPVRTKTTARKNIKSPGISPSFGAVVPVWVTVDVPTDALAGDYRGRLTINVNDAAPVVVPVELNVSGWRLPEPKNYRTFVEIVQSPESVALQYQVPLWSDEHFKLIEKSLKVIGSVGNKTVYIPLVCETNMGNAESMVRWIKQPDGTYKHDFTIMEKYLDLVEKYQGKPALVCFYVWDPFLGHVGRGDDNLWTSKLSKKERKAYMGRGAKVSLFDRATGKVSLMELPPYTDDRCKPLLKPLLDEVVRRVKKRGLANAMTLGLMCDWVPDKKTVETFSQLLPGVPWANHSHGYRKSIHGVDVKLRSHVYSRRGDDIVDPSIDRKHGWQTKEMKIRFPRDVRDSFHLTMFRHMGEVNIAGKYRGFARRGGDFWLVLKNRRGERVGNLAGRYPKSTWGTIDIATCLLAPGKNGAITTARFEMLREGVQECEARIFIDRALVDKTLRAKLGDDLARRCQAILDERTRALLRGLSSFIQSGAATHHAAYTGGRRGPAGMIGYQWYVGSGWQERSMMLYSAAAEVEKALEKP